jgi:hypothetical protein
LAGTIGGAIGLQSPSLFVDGMNLNCEKVPYLIKADLVWWDSRINLRPGQRNQASQLWVSTGLRLLFFALLSMGLSAVITFFCIMSIYARFLYP